jgi:tripartite-type tricarboxylate transporter receptor subunit TctC
MKIHTSSGKRIFTAIAALLVAGPLVAFAQQWPIKPVRIIVPLPPGQAADIIARQLAEKMSPALGQQVIVDNRPGAGTMIGSELAAKSAPDGYTYLAGGSSALAINPHVYAKLAYDTLRDFAPVTQMVSIAFVLCVNPSLPVRSVQELVKLAKRRPGEISFGSTGNGGTNHIATSTFASMMGIDLIHVPYKGAVASLTDLIGGQISMLAETTPVVLPFVKAGKIRAIGVYSIKRNPFLPDVPTLDEQGVKGFDMNTWTGLVAPAGTPPAILDRMNAEAVKALNTPEVQQRLSELGFIGVGNTREQFGAYLKSELAKWAAAVKVSGARVE